MEIIINTKLFRRVLIAVLALTLTLSGAFALAEVGTARIAIREFGESTSVEELSENVTVAIEYPITGIEPVDQQITTWAQELAEDFNGEIKAIRDEGDEVEGELTVEYDAYRVNERYVGIAETGMLSHSHLAHPADVAQTFNLDIEEGRLLTAEDIFPDASRDKVYDLLDAAIAKIDDAAGPADETWLDHIVLTGDGVDVITARGEHFASALGMQRITLSYGELEGLLGIDVSATAAGNDDTAEG